MQTSAEEPAVHEGLTGDVVTRANGEIIGCNRLFADMFGFASAEQARGTNILLLLRSRREGTELLDLIREQNILDRHELEMRRQDGEPVYVIARLVGVFGPHGELVEIRSYLFNDTKRKRVEQQLVQGQKMESLGTLAGGIAHDFNNILAIILGWTNRLELAATHPEEIPKATGAIKSAVERGATLVQQLLTAAQQSEARFTSFDLNTLILETADMLQSTLPKTTAFSFALNAGLPQLTGDRSQIHQVLLNLCVNAHEAMPRGGTIRIGTSIVSSSDASQHFTGTGDCDYVSVTVRDTGAGMTREVKTHIFEPFFTTKERGKGTGMGLSVVYGVVNHHRGFVEVETAPGAGSTFTLYLPLDSAAAASTGDEQTPGASQSRAPQLILLVEDEEMLRELGVTFLEAEGYRVITAGDGVQALELFELHRDEIGLVVCDLGLPKLDGRQVFLRMKQSRPGVRTIVASGYLEPTMLAQLTDAGVLDTVRKPYDFNELVAKVRSIIGAPQKAQEHPELF